MKYSKMKKILKDNGCTSSPAATLTMSHDTLVQECNYLVKSWASVLLSTTNLQEKSSNIF